MIAFPCMLVEHAQKAGIKVPEDPESFNAEEFPHFHVFCQMQLCRRLPYWSVVWENAEVIAKIPTDKIREITYPQIIAMGFKT